MNSPCYDVERKIDCPRRCAGCSVECPEWAAYVNERNDTYEKKVVENAARGSYYDGIDKRVRKAAMRRKSPYRSNFIDN